MTENKHFIRTFKILRILKLHDWFKSYGDIGGGWVDLAKWLSFIGEGLLPSYQAMNNKIQTIHNIKDLV